jgi:hypothetical protein
MRKLGRLMCLSLLSLLCAAAAYGAVTMTASLGLGGNAPATGWCPVLVDIHNDGEARKARLTIPADESSLAFHSRLSGRSPLICSRDLQLPERGRLRCFLYIPAPSGSTSIGLKVGSEAQVVPLSSRTFDSLTRAVVVIGSGPDRFLQELDGLPVRPPEEGSPAPDKPLLSISQVPWCDLPDQWLGWSGITAVVLASRQWEQATVEVRQALLQWVRLGGTLIVPGGALASAYAPDLREVLPLQATSLAPQGNLAAVGRWLGQTALPPTAALATGALRKSTGTLCAVGDQPLVVTAPLGSGEIIMTAFDYAAPEVEQWALRVDLWRRLVGNRGPLADRLELGPGGPVRERTGALGAGDLTSLAGKMPQARRLPWRGMVLYLLVYVVLLGPVQFLLLRQRGRRWSWLLTLGIIIFFTLNAFLIGTALRGRRAIIYRPSALVAAPGGALASGLGAVGVFSPGRGAYSFTTEPAEILLAGYSRWSAASPRLSQDARWRLDTDAMAMWTLNIAQAAFAADLGQGVDARAVWDGETLQVRVNNGTGLTLRGLRVLADERRALAEQTLAPGQSLEVRYSHSVRPERPVEARGRSDMVYGMPPPTTVKPEALAEELVRLAQAATESASDLNAANPVLLAVSIDPVAPLTPTDRRALVKDATVLRVPLRATLEQGETVAVPAWLVGKRSLLAENPGTPVTTTPRRHLLEYRVPMGPLGGTLLSLSFVMPEQLGTAHGYPRPDDPEEFKATDVAAFNFRTGRWQTLPRDLERWRVPTPDQFLTSDGRLQLSYRLPEQLPPERRHGSQELNTTLELKAVVRAW